MLSVRQSLCSVGELQHPPTVSIISNRNMDGVFKLDRVTGGVGDRIITIIRVEGMPKTTPDSMHIVQAVCLVIEMKRGREVQRVATMWKQSSTTNS
jgi:hypothetical protein